MAMFEKLLTLALVAGATALTESDQNKPPRPILVFHTGNGLHNQIMSFVDGLVVAQRFGFDAVLPTMWGSAHPSEDKTQPMRWGNLYDAPHFADCFLRSTSLQVFPALPPGSAAQQANLSGLDRKVNMPDSKSFEGRLWAASKSAAENLRPAVDIGRWYARWFYVRSDAESFQGRRRVLQCLRPSRKISHAVSKVLTGLRTEPNLHFGDFASIHLRLESDWKEHCEKQGNNNKLAGMECLMNEEVWASRLARASHPYKKLYIMGGVHNGGHGYNLDAFRRKGFDVVSKKDFLAHNDLVHFRYASAFAAIDFFVALESPMVYGNFVSSMDTVLWEMRLYKCRPMETIHDVDIMTHISSYTSNVWYYRLDDVLYHFNQTCRGAVPK